jgi:hypothetical protein
MTVVDEKKVRRNGRIQSASSIGEGIDNMTKRPLSDYWGVGEGILFHWASGYTDREGPLIRIMQPEQGP